MADVVNRKTLEYRKRVNTPDFPETDWLINPWLPDCPRKYWKVVKDAVVEMGAEEKAAVDATEAEEARYRRKPKTQILNEIWNAIGDEKGDELAGILNANSVWLVFLEDGSYTKARAYMRAVRDAGGITQEIEGLIDGILPLQR